MDTDSQVRTASGINVIAGIWLIIAPFTLGYASGISLVNDVILGIIIAGFALWSNGATAVEKRHGGRHAHA